MSYSTILKREIFNKELTNKDEIYAELFGIFSSKNVITENGIYFSTENVSLAKRVYSCLKVITELNIQLKYLTNNRLGTHKIYEVVIVYLKENETEYKKLIDKINKSKENLKNKKNIVSSIIRGFFMSCGYIKAPEKGYALDFFVDTKESATFLYSLFKKMEKRVFQTEKKSKNIVYLRNSEDILDIIFLIGGVNSFFEFEEVTINKEIRNKINRTMNWEIANETKKLSTSEKQINMIEAIKEKIGLENISQILRETAEKRIENEEMSLQELADLMGVSKSGIRNRFRRIEEIYKSLES